MKLKNISILKTTQANNLIKVLKKTKNYRLYMENQGMNVNFVLQKEIVRSKKLTGIVT
jgi:hypothetical protein